MGHEYSPIRARKIISIGLVSACHRSAVMFSRHLASVRRIAQVVETTSRAIRSASRAYPRCADQRGGCADQKGGVTVKGSATKPRSLEEWFWRLVFVGVVCDFLYLGWFVLRLLRPRWSLKPSASRSGYGTSSGGNIRRCPWLRQQFQIFIQNFLSNPESQQDISCFATETCNAPLRLATLTYGA